MSMEIMMTKDETGNLCVEWLNTYFEFDTEGNLTISDEDGKLLFKGDELNLYEKLGVIK